MNAFPNVTNGPWEPIDQWRVYARRPGTDEDFKLAYAGQEEDTRAQATKLVQDGMITYLIQAQQRIQTKWGFQP